jgi:uncharacterized protein
MDDREDLCRRCGVCCHEKFEIGEMVIITDVPCQHLDPATNLCRIYRDRHTRTTRCLSVEEGIERRAFPADCPYVRDLPDYKPPVFGSEIEGFEAVVGELMDSL